MQSNIEPTVQVRRRLPRPIIVLSQLLITGGALLVMIGLLWLTSLTVRPAARPSQRVLTNQPQPLFSLAQPWSQDEHAAGKLVAQAAFQTLATGRRLVQVISDKQPTDITIITHHDGFGAIEMSPRGPYTVGQTVSLYADASPEWLFEKWSGAVEGEQNPLTLTINGPTEVTATFRSVTGDDYYFVTTATVGQGQVGVMPGGPFLVGQVTLLTATPAPDWQFIRWSGDIGEYDNPLSLVVNDDFDVVAIFGLINPPPTITLAAGVEGEGALTIDPAGPYTVGQAVTLTATAADGWHFEQWRGDLTGATNPYSLLITTDTTVVASFEQQIPPPLPTMTVYIEGEGAVDVSPASPFTPGQSITLKATADEGWRFAGWRGALNGTDNPASLTIIHSFAVTATFELSETTEPTPEPPELTVQVVGEGEVARDAPASLSAGQRVTLTAQPAEQWHFIGWSGDIIGQQNPHSLIVTQSLTITATFTETPTSLPTFALTVELEGPGQVYVEPPGPYEAGEHVTLDAQANEQACFVAWHGELTGQEEVVTIVMLADLAVTAQFGPCPLHLPLVTSP